MAAADSSPAGQRWDGPSAELSHSPPAQRPAGLDSPSRPRKALTIGAVAKILGQEFADISISKIRYLEDQRLLAPRRTRGGYRLYSQADVERLRTILRLQRDEFLPLRVIRQELAAGRHMLEGAPTGTLPGATRRALGVAGANGRHSLAEVLDQTGAEEDLVRELEEFGVIEADTASGRRTYDDTDREIVRAVGELARFGVAGRNLRVFRSSADREAALLEQILGGSLRSRNPKRRKEAIETLENLAAITSHLKHLLLVRDLRKLAG